MASCDVQALLDEQPCYSTLLKGQRQWVKAQLLCDLNDWLINGGTMPSCDVQGLLDDAACIAALTAGQVDVVIAQLECDVNSNIGNLRPTCGNGNPNGVVTVLYCGQLYDDIDPTSPTYQSEFRFLGTVGTNTGWV